MGIALNPTTVYPGTDHERDLEAAIRADGLRNRFWLDPLAGRGYPADMVELGDLMPEIETGDMEAIASPIDFLGVNYYNPDYVVDDPGATPLHVRFANRPEMEHTAMGWIVQPSAFAELLVRRTRTTSSARCISPRTAPLTTTPCRRMARSPTLVALAISTITWRQSSRLVRPARRSRAISPGRCSTI